MHYDGDNWSCQRWDRAEMADKHDCKQSAEILSLNTVYNLVSSTNSWYYTLTDSDISQVSSIINIKYEQCRSKYTASTDDRDEHDWSAINLQLVNPLMSTGNYSVTSNNMKLVHWPLMDGLLHSILWWEDWAGPQPAQAPPRCTKCNSLSINGQCANYCIAH